MNKEKNPEKSSAWSEEERERRSDVEAAPPPASSELVVPAWASSFPVGATFPLNGWNVRIAGHFLNDRTGHAEGFAITVEGPTAALKKLLAASKRKAAKKKLRVVKR